MISKGLLAQCVIGLQGTELSEMEKRWLSTMPPLGVILFTRNIESPEQVQALLSEARDYAGAGLWASIDEEGGRVNRMPWTPFSGRRHAAEYGEWYLQEPEAAKNAVFEDAMAVGKALAGLGFTHDCAPVLDLQSEGGHAVIGKRAYSDRVEVVAALGVQCMLGLQQAGIAAIGKHFPGHGRANADSHLAVPNVDVTLEVILSEAQSFAQLFAHGLQHVMTAHVHYTQVDQHIATMSPFWLKDILRQHFGFTGRVWSDDLCMKGAGNDVPDAVQKAAAAGCDVLLVCEPEGVASLYQ